ncbi:PP-loop family-domain-containing protein [Aspergillus varians]
MALAYLCRQWEMQKQRDVNVNVNDRDRNDASVTAFVVDHKARKESTQEANTVADWLRGLGASLSLCLSLTSPNSYRLLRKEIPILGITTQILPLDWTGVSASAFETHARRLRFQALGRACRDRGIEALLMGHHQDDNVETTIWRLCSGARGAGLAGINAVARIPECHGLYGVSGSGETVTVHPGDFVESQQSHHGRNWGVSTGGILICRPLLSFPKSRLVATCHENKIPFVTDPTNFDPTLTPRNAIRSLLSSNSLPRALQNPSILSLIEKCQSLIHDSHRLSDDILKSQCRLLDISLASGSLTVQFKSPPPSFPSEHQNQEIPPQRLHELQSLTLRRITELISPFPENHFSLSSYEGFTNRVFRSPPATPGLLERDPDTERERQVEEERARKDRKPFTLGGVLFHPLSSSNTSTIDHDDTTWLLTRQPYMRRRDPILRFNLPISKSSSKSTLTSTSATATATNTATYPKQHPQSIIPWTLWDNRFWIRASLIPRCDSPSDTPSGRKEKEGEYNNTPITVNGKQPCPEDGDQSQLVIRPLRQSDLSALRRLHTKSSNYNSTDGCKGGGGGESTFSVPAFFEKLDREAPGLSRFTVPVLAIAEAGAAEGIDVPLALPTIDLMFPGLESSGWTMKWEWKYKMVDPESLKLMGSV